MNAALLELYRHMTWATVSLIEFCEGLDEDHLDAGLPGTFGTVRETLRHLVNAEEGYLATVTGEPRPGPLPGDPVSMTELAARVRRLGPRWEAVAQDDAIPGRDVTTADGWRMQARVPMAQAVHHADDHRTHVLSILGGRGLDLPNLSVWGYAEESGHMVEVGPG